MKATYSIIILSVLVLSCNPDKKRIVDRNDPQFQSNDASRLFLKNVRMLFYNIEKRNDGKIEVWRLKSRTEDSSEAIINVDIINNWHQDKAYPMISLSPYFNSLDTVELKMSGKNGFSEVIRFDKNSTMDRHFYFASAIYEGLLKGYDFELLNTGEKIFSNQEQREAFRISMVDFYRLVAIY